MEHVVIGCINCPMYSWTGIEYRVYCHHPKRPIEIVVHDMNNKWQQVVPTETEIKKYTEAYVGMESDKIVAGLNDESRKTGRSIIVEEPIVENDNNSDPITPDWCPIAKEPITIIKK